ncbi:MAG: acyl carrier protein [Spirochaetes bacterium]|jgi:acyl carrier protein|nr:acyl carrier protein [Brevinematales bacterium]MCL1959206.1 acyl carrier protein [Spirochaetota bacterium]
MSKEEIFLRIKEILNTEFEIDNELINRETKLYADIELDSIDAVDLMVKMKEYVKDKIEPEQFKKAITIQDVVDILYPLINKS